MMLAILTCCIINVVLNFMLGCYVQDWCRYLERLIKNGQETTVCVDYDKYSPQESPAGLDIHDGT